MSYYFYTNHPYFRQSDQSLITDIETATQEEFQAITCYEKLARMAPKEVRNQILEIREDERKHLQVFQSIYSHLTGRQPSQPTQVICANSYREGLIAAFKDEQNSVDFYLEIADRAQDRAIREAFQRAALDEQNHAVWFSFFLMSQR
ncbi:ferritin-like domain-containing protein [Caldibacillus lycopersici]|uniref:Ferritin-like domain-containing protein n=1 Tax=Perspicuibacillus lycopersici TaxID=1325689 RepID=A0AAE3IRU3_9BACI|nr:ferritin-like domain-containing protein [Perspicuibacillus lycopersici]MCU9613252.1 ferritin-like domain-containing protein [Perspicuibacillus lycopersici]